MLMDDVLNEQVRARLKKVVVLLKTNGAISGLGELATKLGYSNLQAVSHIINGPKPIPKMFLVKFEELFPCVNVNYIKTGEGEPLKQERKESHFVEEPVGSFGAGIEHLMSIVSDYQRRLDEKENQLNRMMDLLSEKNK